MGGNALYIFVIAGTILLIYSLKKEKRGTAILTILFLILMLYNPISYSILTKVTGNTDTYYRFLWLVPAHIMLAFFIYESIRKIESLKWQLLVVSVICVGILYMTVSKENISLPDNASQVSTDTLEIATQLDTIMAADNVQSVTIIVDQNVFNALRQYDARICFPVDLPFEGLSPERKTENILGIMSMLMYNRNDIPSEVICSLLEEAKVDYLVINIANDISLAYMQQLGWQIVATTSAYHILQYSDSGSSYLQADR